MVLSFNQAALRGYGKTRAVASKLRRIRKATRKTVNGGAFNPLTLIPKSLGYWFKYGKSWHGEKKDQEAELERLRKLKASRGGKFELADLRDGFLGPVGWIRMAKRKQRQREIEKLKKELGES